MNTQLICTVADNRNHYIELVTNNIKYLDKLTAQFNKKEDFYNNSSFSQRIAIFIYDNSEDIIEGNLETELFIKYKPSKEELNILKIFINSFSTNPIIYLPVIFYDQIRSEKEIEQFIKDNSSLTGKIFLNKIKSCNNKYLYLRIYENYILEKRKQKQIKKII